MNRGGAAGLMAMFGGGMLLMGLGGMGEVGALGLGIGLSLFGVILLLIALYLLFGNSLTLRNWDTKVMLEERSKNSAHGVAGAAGDSRMSDRVTTAQINAVSNPQTARALQDLQNLLYTQAISDSEFQAAKDRLLRSDAARAHSDAVEQLEKLVELHQAGILNDVEFAAAKLKVLGL